MSIILASGSPRRKQLLEMLGLSDMLVIPAVGEERADEALPPEELVKMLALQKGMEIASERAAEDVVISADTIVWHRGRVFGKPHSEQEAFAMLRELSGEAHKVFTGVCVIHCGRTELEYEMTLVRFREMSDDEIRAYIATGEPMDKAGAYGAQGIASLFIEGIEGDFFNVMGLPLCRLGRMLKNQGVGLL